MTQDRTRTTGPDVALLQARRALALAERDREALVAAHRQAEQRRAMEQAQVRRDEEKRRAYIAQLEVVNRDLTAAHTALREEFHQGEAARRGYITKLEDENRELVAMLERSRQDEAERQGHIADLQRGKDELLTIYNSDTQELRSYIDKLEKDCEELRRHFATSEAGTREAPASGG